jgi:hypothetical protein
MKETYISRFKLQRRSFEFFISFLKYIFGLEKEIRINPFLENVIQISLRKIEW